MKPYLLAALKEIALLGGVNGYVTISSKELGNALGISQQSASARILELVEEGLITRNVGARRQQMTLTENAMHLLRKEYAEYQKIFELARTLVIRGIVTPGLGEGSYYMSQEGYMNQFRKRLSFEPFVGTLNLRIEGPEIFKLEILKKSQGMLIRGFTDKGRSFGDVKCFPSTLSGLECAVIMPVRTHHASMIEVISRHYLREKLGLKDGEAVEVQISL